MAKINLSGIDQFVKNINSDLQTPAGKREILSSLASDFNPSAAIMNAAEDLKRMLIVAAESEFTLSEFSVIQHIENIDIGSPVDLGDGKYRVDLMLHGDLHRPSLNPYNPGIDNIVSLFSNGWSAKHTPFGVWRGELVHGRASQEPRHFAQFAIDQFNIKHNGSGVSATLSDGY